MKRITRSNEKIIAGVIGGISNYLNPELDPVFCRIAYFLLTFYNPAFLLIYLGMAFIIPAEGMKVSNSSANN